MKPSWDDAPEWATWVARDQDGEWYWYEFEPIARYETFNPAHTMTKNGLEECLDACNKVASQALVKGTEQ